jgi:hypothetical protein
MIKEPYNSIKNIYKINEQKQTKRTKQPNNDKYIIIIIIKKTFQKELAGYM